MKWLSQDDYREFLSRKDYDIRKSGNARWIDQKCTPDILTIIADCIINYLDEKGDPSIEFQSIDIWHATYTKDNVLSIFKKPDPDNETARNEYDKFFQQPMELFSYAGILNKVKKGNKNFYRVNDIDLLFSLSFREKNSLNFLIVYIEKVLVDSGIYGYFLSFFSNQTAEEFLILKEVFTQFTINNTPINGDTECRRIFTKVLNPLAYNKNSRGTERGRLSKNKITLDMLMYNRENFRDKNVSKPKEVTRKEHKKFGVIHSTTIAYFRYKTAKAKKIVRNYNDSFNNGFNEIDCGVKIKDSATQIHHIFMEASYPTISYYIENLIALTPTQHYNYAHVNGNTNSINKAYQCLCLLAKSRIIEECYENHRDVYDFNKFVEVLTIGLDTDAFKNVAFLDFTNINTLINQIYNEI